LSSNRQMRMAAPHSHRNDPSRAASFKHNS
jgi:hypothetical protein